MLESNGQNGDSLPAVDRTSEDGLKGQSLKNSESNEKYPDALEVNVKQREILLTTTRGSKELQSSCDDFHLNSVKNANEGNPSPKIIAESSDGHCYALASIFNNPSIPSCIMFQCKSILKLRMTLATKNSSEAAEAESDQEEATYTNSPDSVNGPGLPPKRHSRNIEIVEGKDLQAFTSLEQSLRKKMSHFGGHAYKAFHHTHLKPIVSSIQLPEILSNFHSSAPEDSSTSGSEHEHEHGIDADLFISLNKQGMLPCTNKSWFSRIMESISTKIHHSRHHEPHTRNLLSAKMNSRSESKIFQTDSSSLCSEDFKLNFSSLSATADEDGSSKEKHLNLLSPTESDHIIHTSLNSEEFPLQTPGPDNRQLSLLYSPLVSTRYERRTTERSHPSINSPYISHKYHDNSINNIQSTHQSSPTFHPHEHSHVNSHLAQSFTASEDDSGDESRPKFPSFTKWREEKILGKGANGVVHLGHVEDYLHQDVLCAIKEFRKKRKNESAREYAKKVVGEFCISSSLHHPNIVIAYDLIHKQDNKYYEVMEYCAGGDMYSFLDKSEVLTSQANDYFAQLMEGVNYLHELGVVHRDLKLENILLSADHKIVKITDFGSASVYKTCFERSARKLKGAVGTDPYIAPEEWDHEVEYDPPKVDVWSCGIIYYALIHRTVPWKISKTSDFMYKDYIKKKDVGYAPFEDIETEQLRNLLYQMLDPDPNTRISSGGTLEVVRPFGRHAE